MRVLQGDFFFFLVKPEITDAMSKGACCSRPALGVNVNMKRVARCYCVFL